MHMLGLKMSRQDGEAVGCDERGVSADAGGGMEDFVWSVSFSPDGTKVASGSLTRPSKYGATSPQRTESDDALPSPSQSEKARSFR